MFDKIGDSVTYNDKYYSKNNVFEGAFSLFSETKDKIEDKAEIKKNMDENLENVDLNYLLQFQNIGKNQLEYIRDFASQDMKDNLSNLVEQKVLNNANNAHTMLLSDFGFIRNQAEKTLKNKINQYYNIPNFNIDVWHGKYGIDFNENLETMRQIENVGPGSVKKLYDDYGIMEFHRYPAEVLISQVVEEDAQQPYGVVVFPRADHNDAFDGKKYIFDKLYSETRGKYAIKIAECESKTDLARKFITLDKKYGESNKISFLLMGGHGSGDALNLGEQRTYNETIGEKPNPKAIYNFESESPGFIKANNKYFDKDAEVVFLSCSAGITDGIADKFSSSYNKKMMAPVIPVSKLDLDINYDANGKPHFKAVYDQNEAISANFGQEKPVE